MALRVLLGVAFAVVSSAYALSPSSTLLDGLLSSRLAGGTVDAKDREFPYQASLRIKGDHFCGGALLSRQWIATSAHCIAKYGITNFIVVLGSNSLLSGGVAFRIQEAKYHPEYERKDHLHDIALVKLSEPVEYSEAIAPVKLPMGSETPGLLSLTSWPSLYYGKRSPASFAITNYKLKVIRLPTITLEECRRVFPSVTGDNVCTLSSVPGQGLCYGDAGSPLVANGTLYAIGSWGSPCAVGYPDVHIRIFEHIDWIEDFVECDEDDEANN